VFDCCVLVVPEGGLKLLYLKVGCMCCTCRWAECFVSAVPEGGLSVVCQLYLKVG
jgi:hypothetical protein